MSAWEIETIVGSVYFNYEAKFSKRHWEMKTIVEMAPVTEPGSQAATPQPFAAGSLWQSLTEKPPFPGTKHSHTSATEALRCARVWAGEKHGGC